MDDNFKTIVNVAKFGRSVYINIQKFVQFQLTVNIVALMINFVSACISGLLTYQPFNTVLAIAQEKKLTFLGNLQDLPLLPLFSCCG